MVTAPLGLMLAILMPSGSGERDGSTTVVLNSGTVVLVSGTSTGLGAPGPPLLHAATVVTMASTAIHLIVIVSPLPFAKARVINPECRRHETALAVLVITTFLWNTLSHLQYMS